MGFDVQTCAHVSAAEPRRANLGIVSACAAYAGRMSRTSWLCLVTTLVWLPACPKGAPAVEDATPHVTASPTDASALEPPAQTTTASDAGARGRPTWVPKLGDEAAFLAYSKKVGNERFAKLVVAIASGDTFYVDPELYPMHKDFIFAEILRTPRTPEAQREIDKNYGKVKPAFLMLYVVHHLREDKWTLAFWDGDKAQAAHLKQAFARAKATFYLADKLAFRPASDEQEAVAKSVPEIPVLTNDVLYKSGEYQPFRVGRAVGKLRLVPAGAKAEDLVFDPGEIVILPEPLTDITRVAGIVSQTFSTPLSHVNLRAAAWDIPNVGLRGAATTYAALDGKMVVLEATSTSAAIRAATKAEVDREEARRKDEKAKTAIKVPAANLSVRELRTLDAIGAGDASIYGAKTANLGRIVSAKLQGFTVPAGFGVPVVHYAEHLKAAGLDARITAMLADPDFRKSPEARKKKLAELRAAIVAAPVAPAFAASVKASLEALGAKGSPDAGVSDAGLEPPRVFVRSSTNAEDLPGFSGAGLYDTVPNVRGDAAVLEAIKRVWASVWNFAAYEERELYGIDHAAVLGAVLVQVGIDATAAGVLVTAHPTNADDTRTFTINAKSGLGIRVVDGKKVPEIILYNTHNRAVRVVSRSDEDTMLVFDPKGGVREVPTPEKGKPILTTARVERLAAAALRIKATFPKDQPLDIEWLFRGEEVFVVQARPFLAGPKKAEGPGLLP